MKIIIICLFYFLLIFSTYSYGFVQHLATPVIDTENATHVMKGKKDAEQRIHDIQRKQNEKQRKLDCLSGNTDSTLNDEADNSCN